MVSRRDVLVGTAAAALVSQLGWVARLGAAEAAMVLVPMDDDQQNHLKAYGLAYAALKAGGKSEWLLNYRGGSFLLPDLPEIRKRAALDGVTIEGVDDSTVGSIRSELAGGNMDSVV